MSAPMHVPVVWAQRADSVIITLDLQDVRDPDIKIINDEEAKAGKVYFEGKAHSHATGPEEHAYNLELELFGEVDQDDVKQSTTARTITLRIGKKEPGPYWPRLLKAAGKAPPYIKVDWDRWVDEDEEAEDDMASMEQFSGMGGGGGMPGGMDMASLMSQMGGGGGRGGGGGGMPGGMDMASLMAQMGQGGGGGGGGFEDDDEGSDDDDLPPLETAAPQ